MQQYPLISGVTAVQQAPAAGVMAFGSSVAQPGGAAGSPNTSAVAQSFFLVVTGSGAVSAMAQVMGSNDGVNWTPYGPPITATAATGTSVGAATGLTPFVFFTGYVTAVSGTNASVSLTMGC